MARNINNILLQGYTGMIGNQLVLKIRNGKPYLANRPTINKDRVPTPNQVKARERFANAVRFAQRVIQDPVLNSWYEAAAKDGNSAYNTAISDANDPPELTGLNTAGYHGQPGELITIVAMDNYFVEQVMVAIYAASGDLLEEGAAVPDSIRHEWTYAATRQNLKPAGSRIVVVAEDKPKNKVSIEKTI
jgi:hypothetical protein